MRYLFILDPICIDFYDWNEYIFSVYYLLIQKQIFYIFDVITLFIYIVQAQLFLFW